MGVGELFSASLFKKRRPQRVAPSALKMPAALNAKSYYNNQNLQSAALLQLKNNQCSLLRKAVGRETGGVLICTGAAGFFRDQRRAGEGGSFSSTSPETL